MAPVQAVHQPSDMIAVVVHPELTLDNLGNSRRGPQVGPVAVRDRPFEVQLHQAAPLGRSQPGRAPRGRADLQSLRSSSLPGIAPPHDGTGVALDATGNFIEGETGLQERQSSPAPIFQQVGVTLQSGPGCSLPFFECREGGTTLRPCWPVALLSD